METVGEEEFIASLDRRYRSIGKFVHEFSALELRVSFHLTKTMRLEQEFANILTANIDFAALYRCLGGALKLRAHNDQQRKDVDKIINMISKINDQRNRIVHGAWLLDQGAFHTSRQSLKTTFHFHDFEEVEKLSEKMGAVQDELGKLEHSPVLMNRL